MTEQEVSLIRDLAGAVGKSAEYVTGEYTQWVFVNSLGWVALGVVLSILAKKLPFAENSEVAPWGQWLIKGVILTIGMVFIASSLPDVISPIAPAINKLITAIR